MTSTEKEQTCNFCHGNKPHVVLHPCMHWFHSRCIFPWPISVCPLCDKSVVSAEPKYTSLDGDGDVLATNCRSGRWISSEEDYARLLISNFHNGTLPLGENTKLNGFLCDVLQCNPSRLASKIRTGKKLYHCRNARDLAPGDLENFGHTQRRLTEHEEDFFCAILVTHSPKVAGAVLRRIQQIWCDQFIQHAVAVGQVLSFPSRDCNSSCIQTNHVFPSQPRRLNNDVVEGILTDISHVMQNLHEEQGYTQSEADDWSKQGITLYRGGNNLDVPPPTTPFTVVKDVHGERDNVDSPTSSESSQNSVPPTGDLAWCLNRMLEKFPFECVDLWVPVTIDDHELLLMGGSASIDEKYRPWLDYSKNFSFQLSSGVPGRVYSSDHPECIPDLNDVPMSVFHRRDGALRLDIRSVFAVPMTSCNGPSFVAVFYSTDAFMPTTELQREIYDFMCTWKFNISVVRTYCDGTSSDS
mmetsp:Transcript_23103/g.33846  ORF Transcript_23103/g.33846 Transcript_23103/m.33846 type:complete len:468 (+) Transcript_23103:185-1588(+)|eukprot:CAMPEP_0185032146 /NCGR_PEP_ID=MMETSP1103-20130426/20038_1 /TAXON_ID=36769 /ORGANISM="Paraphysomonas bandaiensis, Strain Caron Lab Isolate" /LENGTH=467 /DNA_ID=CAMNT_0027567933 /DNA_START=106 /DNA_END=1512 /DNA_ORIENTATION=-